MSTAREHEISLDILMVLAQHQRLARDLPCISRPCVSCIAAHRRRVALFVARGAPSISCSPHFPASRRINRR
jgi:hypothetical protein